MRTEPLNGFLITETDSSTPLVGGGAFLFVAILIYLKIGVSVLVHIVEKPTTTEVD